MKAKVVPTLALAASICAILFLLGTFAFAQDTTTQSTPPQAPTAAKRHMAGRAGRLQQMAQYLNLTDDQKAKIKPILQNEGQQMQALRKDTTLTPDQRKAKVQEIRQATRSQIEPILTPDQVAKLGNGNGTRPAPKRAGRPEAGPMEWMGKNLNLTDDQKAKMEPLFADQQKQVQAVKQDSSLSAEQKRAKIAEIRKATHQQMLTILTPEQQQQMKQMRGRRMPKSAPAPAQGAQPTPPPGL